VLTDHETVAVPNIVTCYSILRVILLILLHVFRI
jgi:hypothetical protein